MKNNKGFTLIELVVVIVILGILAVTAAPRFLNLSSDARASTLAGLEGALDSALTLVYAKAALEGVESSASATITVNGVTLDLVYGYPQTSILSSGFASDFSGWLGINADRDVSNPSDDAEWLLTDDIHTSDGIERGVANDGSGIGFVPADYSDDDTTSYCGVSYYLDIDTDTNTAEPVIERYDSGC